MVFIVAPSLLDCEGLRRLTGFAHDPLSNWISESGFPSLAVALVYGKKPL